MGTEIQLSREEMANMVGTAVETLVRLLAELKKEGVISTNYELNELRRITRNEITRINWDYADFVF